MPGKNDLRRSLLLGSSNLLDDWIVKHIHIHILAIAHFEVAGADRPIALYIHPKLLMELIDSFLLKIWMAFDLVDDRLDLATSQDVEQDWYCAIANANALGETFLDKPLHLRPDHMIWR